MRNAFAPVNPRNLLCLVGALCALGLLVPPGALAQGLKRASVATPRVFTTSTTASEADLCAPCNDGSQCDSGLCAINSDGNGICTQACSTTVGCPSNFSCTSASNSASGSTALCYPVDASVCPNPYLAPLNTFCQVPPPSNNPNLTITRQCAAGLTCFVFPSSYGACVTACSSLNSNQTCAFGQSCCFGTDANGYCLASTATQTTGGCFTVAGYGASCSQPDHSFCRVGSTCLYGQTAADARCYVGCSTGSCSSTGTCQAFQGVDVCCQAALYNANDALTCQPDAQACQREVGVVCGSNTDCISGLCLKNNTQAACSISCTTDGDCPGAGEDVNGDGVADGGSTCITVGTTKRCWPKLGPAAEPNCAKVATPLANSSQGCSCGLVAAGPEALLAVAALAVRRRLRRIWR